MKKSEISFLNVIFCLLVIFIHICSEPVTKLNYGTVSHVIIFSLWKLSGFVVQGFIMLSGIKLFLSKKTESYSAYLWSRFKKIIIPYIVSVCIYYLYFIIKGYFGFSIKELSKYILRGDLAAQFYFVIVIAQFYILKPLWDIMVNKVPKIFGTIIAAAVSIICIFKLGIVFGAYNDRIFTTYMIYWVIGCFIGSNYEGFIKSFSKIKIPIMLGFIPVAAAEVLFAYQRILPFYLSELLHLLYCLFAIFAFYALAVYVGEKAIRLSVSKRINFSSFYIYLWHVLILFVIDDVMNYIGTSDIATRFIIRGAGVYIFSIFLCGEYLKIKRKIKG